MCNDAPQEFAAFRSACEQGDLAAVQRFVGLGFNVNKSLNTTDGETGCMRAAMHRHVAVVEYLMNNGADLYFRDQHRRTLAHFAVRGSVAPVPPRDGESPDDFKARMKEESDVQGVRLLGLLQAHQCNLWAQDNQYRTPLHYSAAQGHLRIADFLVKHVPSINMLGAQNSSRKTALDVAREHNQISMVYFLEGKMVGCRVSFLNVVMGNRRCCSRVL
jgi:ankyrin repeat protein